MTAQSVDPTSTSSTSSTDEVSLTNTLINQSPTSTLPASMSSPAGATIASFQQQYPQFYAAFMQAWAIEAVLDAKTQNDQLIEIIQDARQEDEEDG